MIVTLKPSSKTCDASDALPKCRLNFFYPCVADASGSACHKFLAEKKKMFFVKKLLDAEQRIYLRLYWELSLTGDTKRCMTVYIILGIMTLV